MLSALAKFEENIGSARNLTALYDYLTGLGPSPFPFDDLLRAQVVYSVSAFDKLVHDIVRIGMVAIFGGSRPPTSKYQMEPITMQLHIDLTAATVPPKEYIFAQEMVKKLRVISYQDPAKISDGLSLIWDESHKWQKIAAILGVTSDIATTKLKLISTRRNAIVHESDMDPISGTKTPITRAECKDVTDFLSDCGRAIVQLVI